MCLTRWSDKRILYRFQILALFAISLHGFLPKRYRTILIVQRDLQRSLGRSSTGGLGALIQRFASRHGLVSMDAVFLVSYS